jgi:hypothetical protein
MTKIGNISEKIIEAYIACGKILLFKPQNNFMQTKRNDKNKMYNKIDKRFLFTLENNVIFENFNCVPIGPHFEQHFAIAFAKSLVLVLFGQ